MRRAYRRGTSRVEKRRKILADLVRIRTAVLDMAYRLTLRSSYAFMATFTASVVIGSERTRAPKAFLPLAKADPCGLRQ
jgi:hypothetical protein